MQQFKKVWRIPVLLSVIILFGLLSSLLGTGVWHLLSWAALVIPMVVIAWKIWGNKNISQSKS